MKIYNILFLNFISLIKTEVKGENKKQNSIEEISKKKDNAENKTSNKRNINFLIDEVVNEIISKHKEIQKTQKVSHELASNLLKTYIESTGFNIDKKMEFKLQDRQNKMQVFNDNIHQEYRQNMDNWTQAQQHSAGVTINAAMQKIQIRQEATIQQFTKDKEQVFENFVLLMNDKIKNKSCEFPLIIIEYNLRNKIDKDNMFYVNMHELINEYYNAQIDMSKYNFSSLPDANGFFDNLDSDIY